MDTNENMSLKRIFDTIKSKKILIAFILILFTLFGYFYSYDYVVPKYKSTSTLLLIPNAESENQTITNSDLTLNSSLITTYANIAKNPKVLKQVISNLRLKMTEEELLSRIEVKNIKNTYIIEIAISDKNPERAMVMTAELADVFMEEIKDIYNLNNIGVVDAASMPDSPYNVKHTKDMAMFLGMGILVSMSIVMLIYIFNNKIEKEEEIEKYLQIKTLGSIPINLNKNEEIIDKTNVKSYAAECINTIRTNILYMNASKNAKTILITSCTPGEGKSWVSANIATSFADINKRVLLIDTDLRKGRTNKIFDIDNSVGLSEYLHSMTGDAKTDLELARKYIKETKIPNLHVLTTGKLPQNPSELLVSNEMKELMSLLKNTYDIIIVDAPPSKIVTDGVILSTIVDSTVLVVNSAKTTVNDLREVKKSIELVGGEIIGAILNKVKISGNDYKKNYYYGNSNKKGNHVAVVEKSEGITVKKIIDESLVKLTQNEYDISYEKKDIVIQEESNVNDILNTQNKYIEEIVANYKKISNQIENIQFEINNNVKELKENNEQILNSVNNKVNEIVNSNNNEIYKIQENVNEKIDEVVNKNNIALENVNNKVEQISNNNNNTLASINQNINGIINSSDVVAEKVSTKVVEIINNNNNAISNNIGIKIQEILKQNNNKIEEMQEHINEKLEDVLDSNSSLYDINDKVDEILNNNDNIAENIESNINEKINNISNEIAENVINNTQEIINNNYAKINTSITEKTSDIINSNNSNSQQGVDKQEVDADIQDQIAKILNEKLGKIEQEIVNINYQDKLNEINKTVVDLKENYVQLYRMVKSSNNNESNSKNVVDLTLWRKPIRFRKKRTYRINEEDISYYDLERSAMCIVPLKVNKIREFNPRVYEKTM